MEFLDAATAASRGLDFADIYYTPEYGRSAELIDHGTWECALSRDGLFFPYMRREITLDTQGGYDIVSPYGYGGVAAHSPEALRTFRQQFLTESRERGLVAEFLRAHPRDMTPEMIRAWSPDNVRHHTTYGVEVSYEPDEYFAQAEGRHRTAVRKALKEGVDIMARNASIAIDSESPFRRIYRETMSRLDAPSRLILDDEYFTRLSALGPDQVSLLEARASNADVIAVAMFMTTSSRAHYHLSGATVEGHRVGATNLLIDHAIRSNLGPGGWLHLGGGVSDNDGLSKFKKSIANTSHQMAMCRTVIDEDRYHVLHEAAGSPTTDFFPSYRAVL